MMVGLPTKIFQNLNEVLVKPLSSSGITLKLLVRESKVHIWLPFARDPAFFSCFAFSQKWSPVLELSLSLSQAFHAISWSPRHCTPPTTGRPWRSCPCSPRSTPRLWSALLANTSYWVVDLPLISLLAHKSVYSPSPGHPSQIPQPWFWHCPSMRLLG